MYLPMIVLLLLFICIIYSLVFLVIQIKNQIISNNSKHSINDIMANTRSESVKIELLNRISCLSPSSRSMNGQSI